MSDAVMTGLSLKLRRVERRVKVMDLAAVMGVGHARISQIENQATVTPDTARRYLDALATFAHVSDSPLEATA